MRPFRGPGVDGESNCGCDAGFASSATAVGAGVPAAMNCVLM